MYSRAAAPGRGRLILVETPTIPTRRAMAPTTPVRLAAVHRAVLTTVEAVTLALPAVVVATSAVAVAWAEAEAMSAVAAVVVAAAAWVAVVVGVDMSAAAVAVAAVQHRAVAATITKQ